MRTSRILAASLASTITLCSWLLTETTADEQGGGSSADQASAKFPIVVDFDTTAHQCYVYGARMTSPLTLRYGPEGMTANNVTPRHHGLDEAGKEEQARRVYASVPYVTRVRRREGLTFHEAGLVYEGAMQANLKSAILAYRRAKTHGEYPRAAAVAMLDSEIVDLSRPIEVGDQGIHVTLRGLVGGFIFDFPLEADTTASIATGPETEAEAMSRAQQIDLGLHVPRPSLLIVSAGALVLFQGDEDVKRGRTEIEDAKRHWPMTPLERSEHTGRIPELMMDEIVTAYREGKSH